MKLPRFRFTVRRLMVAVAVVAGTLAFLMSTKGAYSVGFANVPLRFTILDDTSGRPISRASVRLPGSTVYEATPTGDDGKTTVVIRVMCSGQVSILRKTRHANFSSWRIRVVAPGYRTFTGSLENRTQDPRFHEENPDPPPIEIRMERESDPPEPQ
jgi:hypothetical protein